jgi:hypothetical protein
LPQAIIEAIEEREAAHWLRQAEGKIRRDFGKAGKQASAAEISDSLGRLIDLAVPMAKLSSSRISRAIRGEHDSRSLGSSP